MDKKIGHYAFLAGVLLAVILGLIPAVQGRMLVTVLVVLGVVVGLLNITEKETTPFLIAAVTLMIGGSSTLGLLPALGGIGDVLVKIFTYVLVFVAPAALVVALKTIYALAEEV